MPIIHINRSPAQHPDGYEIAASVDGDAVDIRIIITREAINTMAPPPGTYLQRLNDNLRRFREIASRKYDARQIEKDGSILIETDDVRNLS